MGATLLAIWTTLAAACSTPMELPVCADGYTPGSCSASFGDGPEPMPVGSQFPAVVALTTEACVATALDGLGRGTDFTCEGVPGTRVTYVGDTELPATVTTTATYQDGALQEQYRMELHWDDAARLLDESLRMSVNGEDQGFEQADAWVYAADGTVAETHTRTTIPEPEGAVKGGNYPYPMFSDEGVERAHNIYFWDASGRATRHELRAGLQEILRWEVEYSWSDDGLSALVSTLLVDETDPTPAGCTRPDSNHVQCTAELQYDEAGVLVSYESSGVVTVVSDHCCGSCVPP